MEQFLVEELVLRGAVVLSCLPDGYTWGNSTTKGRELMPAVYCGEREKLRFYICYVNGNAIGSREIRYLASQFLGYVDLNEREVWPYAKMAQNGDVKTLTLKIFIGKRLPVQNDFLTLGRSQRPDEPEHCSDR
jgi:hypothetical protein